MTISRVAVPSAAASLQLSCKRTASHSLIPSKRRLTQAAEKWIIAAGTFSCGFFEERRREGDHEFTPTNFACFAWVRGSVDTLSFFSSLAGKFLGLSPIGLRLCLLAPPDLRQLQPPQTCWRAPGSTPPSKSGLHSRLIEVFAPTANLGERCARFFP